MQISQYLYPMDLLKEIRKVVSDVLSENKIELSSVEGWYAKQSTVAGVIFIFSNKDEQEGMLVNSFHGDSYLAFNARRNDITGEINFNKKISWDFNDVGNAIRYVYLQSKQEDNSTKESIAEGHGYYEPRTISFSNKIINIPNVEGWYAVKKTKTKESRGIGANNRYDETTIDIYDDKNGHQGTILGDGTLRYRKYNPLSSNNYDWKDDDDYWGFKDVKNAVRFVYLQHQQTKNLSNLSESKEKKLDWTKGMHSAYVHGIKGWRVVMKNPSMIDIVDASKNIVGRLYLGDILGYGKPSKMHAFVSRMKWDFEDYENAARFIWMKYNESKNLSESLEEKHIVAGQKIEFPDLSVYAVGVLTPEQIERNKGKDGWMYAELFGTQGEHLGMMLADGSLLASEAITKGTQKKIDIKFPVNIEGIKNAARFIFLHSDYAKSKLSESKSEINDDGNEVINFPEFDGWTATAERFSDMDENGKWVEIDWVIRNSESDNIGSILGDGTFNYVTDDAMQNWNQSDINFKENPKKAVSFLWLKRQEYEQRRKTGIPLSEQKKRVQDAIKCGTVRKFENTPGLMAYCECGKGGKWKRWVVYTGKSPFSGHIIGSMQFENKMDVDAEESFGHLLWRPHIHSDLEPVGDFNGNIENAVRWIWLKMQQKDDVRFKKTSRYS